MTSPLEIVRQHNRGKTATDIGRSLGVCRKRVGRILRATGIPPHKRQGNPNPFKRTDGIVITDDQAERIGKGVPVRDIAAEHGVDSSTVYAAMRKQGIPSWRSRVYGPLSDEAIKDWRTSPDRTETVARRHGMSGSAFRRKLIAQNAGPRPPLAARRPITSSMVKAKRSTLAVSVSLELRQEVAQRAAAEGKSVNGLIARWIREGLDG